MMRIRTPRSNPPRPSSMTLFLAWGYVLREGLDIFVPALGMNRRFLGV